MFEEGYFWIGMFVNEYLWFGRFEDGYSWLVDLRMGSQGLSMFTHGLIGVGAHILYCVARPVPPRPVVTTAVLHSR